MGALPFSHIGLTGGIATGKSAVAAILEGTGAEIVDADALAREAVQPGRPAFDEIVAHFGRKILQPDGAIDRRALAATIFADPVERSFLEKAVHPRVRALAESKLEGLVALPPGERPNLVVEVIPLLYEVGLEGLFDEVWVVACSQQAQLARLMGRDRIDRSAAELRLAAQMPLEQKVARADRVIDNDGSLADLERSVRAALQASGLASIL
ncbi:MAG: dephospho-CoA kinase [Cyanobacteria bacterium REEB65]|nr:dephospho-CoA kinase [Cyanobacteria bacterium REEB65]